MKSALAGIIIPEELRTVLRPESRNAGGLAIVMIAHPSAVWQGGRSACTAVQIPSSDSREPHGKAVRLLRFCALFCAFSCIFPAIMHISCIVSPRR